MISFGGMLAQLGSAIVIIPLIAILESVAIAKAFGEFFDFVATMISFLSASSLNISC